MDKAITDIEYVRKALEREFTSTFINELMPGILHNFANPLNGIMGRSKLLQRKMEDYFKKIQTNYPELMVQMEEEQNKLQNDVASICKESDRFYYMFQDLASKFYAIADKRFDQISLGNLIEKEVRFLDFYLDFKHEVRKTIKPLCDLPYIYGNHSDYSYCFSALFRDCMARMRKSSKKELSVELDCKNNLISVLLQDTGERIVIQSDSSDSPALDNVQSSGSSGDNLAFVQALFKENHAHFAYESMEDLNRITVEIPVNKETRARA